ncbi:MAG: hypothetical protein U0Z26_15450 [Anaerolineales bacterium]
MRSKDIQYIGLGLGIGILAGAVIFGGLFLIPNVRNAVLPLNTPAPTAFPTTLFQPTPTQPPTIITNLSESTQTTEATTPPEIFTPTIEVLPTTTIEATSTATPSKAQQLEASGDLAIVGPLTEQQQLSLYEASITFIAPTLAESKKMSVQINGLRFSDPTTTCGPLAAAILQKAGILNADFVPHNFFLINPDNGIDRNLLERTFPDDRYTNTRYKIKLNKVNWIQQPLLPGDFLYIYAGEQGNFEHMLVVTRVDRAGRAYSVTNYGTEAGFIINEVMLYDPADPTAGIFYQWTKREKQLLGSTGFAGYEVWRQN